MSNKWNCLLIGTNIGIYVYDFVDSVNSKKISSDQIRRDTRMIPVRWYVHPPSDDKFVSLDNFDLRLNNIRESIKCIE